MLASALVPITLAEDETFGDAQGTTVSFSASQGGTVSTNSATANIGDAITYSWTTLRIAGTDVCTATANTGFAFTGWLVNGTKMSGTDADNFTVAAGTTVTAAFVATGTVTSPVASMNVSADDAWSLQFFVAEGGQVTISKGSTHEVTSITPSDKGLSVSNGTLTGTAAVGETYNAVIHKTGASDSDLYENCTIKAVPAEGLTHKVSVRVYSSTPWGTVSPSFFYVADGAYISPASNKLLVDREEVVCTATASPNTSEYTYAFKQWSGVNKTITGDITIYAQFERTPVTAPDTCRVDFVVSGDVVGTLDKDTLTVPYGSEVSATGNSLTIGGQTVTATVPQGYYLTWSKMSGTVNDDITITAYFVKSPDTYSISVKTNNRYYGLVSVDGADGIVRAEFTKLSGETPILVSGDTVTVGDTSIRAEPAVGYNFVRWTSGGSELASGNVNSSAVIVAEFAAAPNNVTISVMPNDLSYGTVSPQMTFRMPAGTTYSSNGATLTFTSGGSTVATATATPKAYDSASGSVYSFSAWSSGSGTVSEGLPITAIFTVQKLGSLESPRSSLSVASIPNTQGHDAFVRPGASITVTGQGVVGTDQYEFKAVQGAKTLARTSSELTISFVPDGHQDIVVTWKLGDTVRTLTIHVVYTLTVSFSQNGGTVEPATMNAVGGTTYSASGNVLTLSDGRTATATPKTGYQINMWSPAQGTVTNDDTVSVGFIQNIPTVETYNVAVTAGAHGSIDKARVTVDKGTTYSASGNVLTFSDGQTVTATPDAGYRVKSWAPASGTVNAASSVQVDFEPSEAPAATYWVTVDSADYSKGSIRGPNGTIVSGQYQAKFPDGARITLSGSDSIKVEGSTFTAVPADGCKFDGWYIGGTKVTSARTVTGPVTILATFSESTPTALSVEDTARNVLVGKATSIPVIWTPADAPATVTASGSGLTVSASGGNVVVTAPAAGDYTVAVTVSAPGYESATGTVSVHAVDSLSFTNDPSAGCVIRGAA